MSLLIQAPSDLQLATIRQLCDERGWVYPDAVASKREASEIITSMLSATYRPERYAVPFSV